MIKVRDIKKDQVFWECEYGINIRYTAEEDAHKVDDDLESEHGYAVSAVSDEGETVRFFQCYDEGFHHYLKLYTDNVYEVGVKQ